MKVRWRPNSVNKVDGKVLWTYIQLKYIVQSRHGKRLRCFDAMKELGSNNIIFVKIDTVIFPLKQRKITDFSKRHPSRIIIHTTEWNTTIIQYLYNVNDLAVFSKIIYIDFQRKFRNVVLIYKIVIQRYSVFFITVNKYFIKFQRNFFQKALFFSLPSFWSLRLCIFIHFYNNLYNSSSFLSGFSVCILESISILNLFQENRNLGTHFLFPCSNKTPSSLLFPAVFENIW